MKGTLQVGLIVFSVVSVLLGVAACDSGGSPQQFSATVKEVRGQTFFCRDSFPPNLTTCPPAAVGNEVLVNGGVGTGSGDATLLMNARNTNFRLLPDSALRYVTADGAGASFLLTLGRVFADHQGSGPDEVTIQSGTTAIVATGTRYSVLIEPDGNVTVSVDKGEVTVEVPIGSKKTMKVTTGQGMHIPKGSTAPPAPRDMTPAERRLWLQVGTDPNLDVK
jgi:hypothetical protein